MTEAVEQGRGQLLVAEDPHPLAERQVRLDDCRAPLVAVGKQVEEQLAAGALEQHKAELERGIASYLTGEIPPELGNLTNLQHLELWGQFTGCVPGALRDVDTVAVNNPITGATLPFCD